MVSLPSPAQMRSLPLPPSILSLPPSATITSARRVPFSRFDRRVPTIVAFRPAQRGTRTAGPPPLGPPPPGPPLPGLPLTPGASPWSRAITAASL